VERSHATAGKPALAALTGFDDHAEQLPVSAGGRPKVLVVDDDAAITATFENILGGEGYDVTATTDAREALELARRQPFDIALLDLVMPRMDGLEVLRRLRELIPECRIVILSAYIEPDREAEAARLGAVAILSKPPDLNKLLRFLSDLTRADDPPPDTEALPPTWIR
jgi:two-component system, response regulator, stage 0 sporulation protein F